MQKILQLGMAGLSSILVAWLAGCATQSASESKGASFKGHVGLQLYSLRDQFKKDVPATLDEVKRFGIRHVELAGTYNLPPEQFKTELAKRGLDAVSAHFPYEKFRDDVASIAREA